MGLFWWHQDAANDSRNKIRAGASDPLTRVPSGGCCC